MCKCDKWNAAVRAKRVIRSAMVLLPCFVSFAIFADARQVEPLWSYAPPTISKGWIDFLAQEGRTRDVVVPDPHDLKGWSKVQEENEEIDKGSMDRLVDNLSLTLKEDVLNGIPVVWITPRGWSDDGTLIVYTHGGAYTSFSARSAYQGAVMAAETGRQVLSIDYTLAPESKWQQTTDQVLAVYGALTLRGFRMGKIAAFGDSAGGGLAMGSLLKMRDLGMELPAALVLWSPWTDITETGDTYVTLKDADPSFTYSSLLGPSALAYADAIDQKNPYVSPVYGDYSIDFPPTLIQGGTKEIFLSNFVRLYQAMDTAGQTAKLDLYEGMPHVFQALLPDSPETVIAMEKVNRFLSVYLDHHK